MAKTRVYELARDLNLTNKILLSKLNDLDISVKSHMSALDDDAVARIKQQLFGKKEETIEETRIKPTVIRRRKKKVTVKAAPEPVPDEAAADTVEEPAEEVPEKADMIEESAAAEEASELVEESAAEEPEPVEEEASQAETADGIVAEIKAEEPVEVKEKKPKKVVKKVAPIAAVGANVESNR